MLSAASLRFTGYVTAAPRTSSGRVSLNDDEFRGTDRRASPRHERGAHRRGPGEEAQAWHAAAREGRLRSHRPGPASRAHGAAQQDAPVPAVRARGHLPDRGLHRDDRRPDRAQRHAPGADARGDPGQRPHLRDAGVQDPGPREDPHRLQLALARQAQLRGDGRSSPRTTPSRACSSATTSPSATRPGSRSRSTSSCTRWRRATTRWR